jgi:Bacterial aa3 type cytochrome c oxidase subunit IV
MQSALTHFVRVSPVMASNDQPNSAHRSTYESFVGFAKWGTIFVVIVLIALKIFLV